MMNDFTERELRRIEEMSQNASRAERGVMVDGWSVGLSPSKARRSRCVNAFYPSVREFEVNLTETRALYRRFGLPCIFRITPFVAQASLDTQLAAMGCPTLDPTCVQAVRINTKGNNIFEEMATTFDITVNVDSGPLKIGHSIQLLRGDSDEEIAALVARWQSLPLGLRSYTAIDRSTNQPSAHVLTLREGDTVGVFDVVTASACRGRGLATYLLSRALADARDDGATSAYLQVVATNPAKRVYERLGFRTAYTYWYREVADNV